VQSMSQAFDRLDVDKSGALERGELRQNDEVELILDSVHTAFPEFGGGQRFVAETEEGGLGLVHRSISALKTADGFIRKY
jgi:hypothetical protein